MKDYCILYIVRHGETDWNIQHLVQGHTDIPLNKKGERQAKEMGKKLNHIHFAAAFSSDLLRAKKTAEIIILEKKIAVQATKVLRERNYGRLEGKSWLTDSKELQSLWEKTYKLTDGQRKKYRLEKVENNEQLMYRFIPFIREMAVVYPQKNILVVTHGGLMRAFLEHLGYTFNPGSVKNTAYIKLESDGIDFFIREMFGVESG